MNTMSASPAEGPGERRTLVWDAPVRVFHWLLAASFAVAWLTADGERWRLVHVTAGYTVAGLVAFRLLWGLVGTRHARFTRFVRGPRAAMAYVASLVRGRPEHHAGHNPAGGLAIVALLGLAALTAAAGWATYMDVAGEWVEEVHKALATAMLALVAIHVFAVLASSWLHRENLVAAMVHGRKAVAPGEGIRRSWRGLAAVLLVAVLAFWWQQWNIDTLPSGPAAAHARDHDDDED